MNWLTDRLMKRSVVDLAGEVDKALLVLDGALDEQSVAQQRLRDAEAAVRKAQDEVHAARKALFEEHPQLAGDTPVTATDSQTPSNGSAWEDGIVETDDADDPRFTGGAVSPVSANENDPLPPIVWEEHD